MDSWAARVRACSYAQAYMAATVAKLKPTAKKKVVKKVVMKKAVKKAVVKKAVAKKALPKKKTVVAKKAVAKTPAKPKPKPKTIVYTPKLDPKVAAYRSKMKSKLAASRKKTLKTAAGTIKISAGKSKTYQVLERAPTRATPHPTPVTLSRAAHRRTVPRSPAQLMADPYTKSSYKASALLGSTTRGPPADPGVVALIHLAFAPFMPWSTPRSNKFFLS